MQHDNQHDNQHDTQHDTQHGTDHETERQFWDDEPTRRLSRVKSFGTERDTTGHGIARPTTRPAAPGTRQHSGATRPTQRPVRRRQTDNGRQSDSGEQSSIGGQSRLPIDPLLRRLGIMIGATVLLIPVALLMRSGNEAQAAGIITQPATARPSLDLRSIPAVAVPAEVATPLVARPRVATPLVNTPLVATPLVNPVHNHPLKRCDNPYTVVAGDYWIRLAGAIDVPLRDLLALNSATVATPLYPGRSVCLPSGATVAPPTTAATTTIAATTTTTPTKSTSNNNSTSKNSTSKSGSAAKPQAPATTAKPPAAKPPAAKPPAAKTTPPTSTEPPVTAPPNQYSAGEADAIIREVWPDDLEDEAVRIASRESHLVPTARNSCCIGLFQIYYGVHRGWLATIGVTSAAQLFDPRVNAQAAFTLYQRSGGFGAWGGS